ncbi:hypothetical protein BKA70DRAFT_1489830 [Coprinopsis sp. MPI-PUGE-AT-0042]|nr:hypothetical protein BKA70DRAFT_1489830 [Coprinopsis sp. MPI-PUGE-AT-0042]
MNIPFNIVEFVLNGTDTHRKATPTSGTPSKIPRIQTPTTICLRLHGSAGSTLWYFAPYSHVPDSPKSEISSEVNSDASYSSSDSEASEDFTRLEAFPSILASIAASVISDPSSLAVFDRLHIVCYLSQLEAEENDSSYRALFDLFPNLKTAVLSEQGAVSEKPYCARSSATVPPHATESFAKDAFASCTQLEELWVGEKKYHHSQ